MDYVSTRARAPAAGFEDALLAGLAPDGGLYVPRAWPEVSYAEIAAGRGAPYAAVAARIISRFAGETFSNAELCGLCERAYAGFSQPRVAPLRQIGDEDWLLELFHGPTLAFKDFAMQILGGMFDAVLERRGERRTIIAATSGDTGAAAIASFRHCAHANVVVLHPEGRVSDVQRRMMTSVDAPNVFNIALKGSFDDCQAIVKALFSDRAFAEAVALSAVNSINWGRIAAQTVYYFTASAAIASEGEALSFVVPTGNFGDIFAGYAAKRMGLPVARLGVATNANDILHRAMRAGDYSRAGVQPTFSPAMDIEVASNFERLLFDLLDRDGAAVCANMEGFQRGGAMKIEERARARMAEDFVSYAAGEDETFQEIKRHHHETGALIDPHTAVGRCAARRLRAKGALKGKIVTISTADPAKFPDIVERASGVRPELPPAHADLFSKPEFFERAPAETAGVKALIRARFGNAL